MAGVVGVAAILGVGAWAWQAWFAQGDQPAGALPADTLAYVAVDLDPPGGQKVAAYNAIRKFPSLKKSLKLGSQDDLRRSLVDQVASEGDCDFGFDDVEDWAGDRAALAVVPHDEPELVVVVQVQDADRARTGLAELTAACDDEDFGFSIDEAGDWAVLARSDEVAEKVSAGSEKAALADDGDFRRLTEAAGEAGVVTAYVAPEAGRAMLKVVEEDPFALFYLPSIYGTADPIGSLLTFTTFLSYDDWSADDEAAFEDLPEMTPEEKDLYERMEHMDELSQAEQDKLLDEYDAFMEEKYGDWDEPTDEDDIIDEDDIQIEVPARFEKGLKDFSGLGGVVRFDDGTLELEVVADPFLTGYKGRYDGTDAERILAGLPADTAAVFGGGLVDGWGKSAVTDAETGYLFGDEGDEAEVLASFKEATGLTPKDLEALGGDSVAFVVRSGFEKAVDSREPTPVPVAALITGDPEPIETALATLRKGLGADFAPYLTSQRTADGVVIGPDAAWLEEIADPASTLGDVDRFTRAVPELDGAMVAAFADLDAGGLTAWLASDDWDDLEEPDLRPLDTIGATVTQEDDQHRLLLRLTFD